MRLLDSNVLIDSFKPDLGPALDWIFRREPAVSAISYVEVLGYHRLSEQDRDDLEALFLRLHVLGLDERIFDRAVSLRQARKLSLGDALIAATATVHGMPLVTRNLDDFDWIEGLDLIDPLAGPPPGE